MLTRAPDMRWCTRPLPICGSDRPSDPLATMKQCSGQGKKRSDVMMMQIKSPTSIMSLYIRIKVQNNAMKTGGI